MGKAMQKIMSLFVFKVYPSEQGLGIASEMGYFTVYGLLNFNVNLVNVWNTNNNCGWAYYDL